MANKDLRLHAKGPKDESWWWYECSGGMRVYVPKHGGPTPVVAKLSWRVIRAALARKDLNTARKNQA